MKKIEGEIQRRQHKSQFIQITIPMNRRNLQD